MWDKAKDQSSWSLAAETCCSMVAFAPSDSQIEPRDAKPARNRQNLEITMSRFWSPIVHSLTPYVAGEQPAMGDVIKLNTNENPYGTFHRDWFEKHRDLIIASGERLSMALKELGFDVLPSSANFLFARHPDQSGAELAAQLRSRGILIRRFSRGRIGDYLRITIGTDAECDRLLAALGEILR
ncbi:aminotransferase class I/II-fold pyridoxal phosphate-dependent enzyme [Rhizobium lusitanum]|uniref:aminotransferase class I/II-fold pyridoxal phosphate-dependent enzyme n=1 Tax=Rhizobium lusitanum TaxID=293958 RepID=UPI0028A6852D|nr:aminotransferase class I/II-fold pyridoxal phosphate-dependent enzyme [Rhizobium lusitanum]